METIVTLAIGGAVAYALCGKKKRPYIARDGRVYDHKETPEEYYKRKLRAAKKRRW